MRELPAQHNILAFDARRGPSLLLLACCLIAGSLLAGCGAALSPASSSAATGGALTGRVHGGQQPISASSIYLFAAGSSGLQSASTSLLNTSSSGISADGSGNGYATTDANGYFNISGDWSCLHASDQVYILAVGGNPGLSNGTNNAAIALMASLGACSSVVSTYPFIDIDEVTTIAAAWSLAQFAADPLHIGASSTNAAGIANAFATAGNIASAAYGSALASTPNGNGTVPLQLVNTLADIIAPCINSAGSSSTGCSSLFAAATPNGGSAPADTFTSAINMARNPTLNITSLYNLASPSAPFQPYLSSAPNDWSLAITYTGGGLNNPTSLGADATGNIWAANYGGNAVSAFSPRGVPLASGGFTGGALNESYGLAVDASNNIWVTDEEGTGSYPHYGSITVLSNTGSIITNTSSGGIYYPESAAADSTGRVWIVNYGSSSVSLFNSSVSALNGSSGWGNAYLVFPAAIAVDANFNSWAANQSANTITEIVPTGPTFQNVTCCDGASGIASDANGNLWVANYYGDSISEVTNSGSVTLNGVTNASLYHPQAIAVDSANNVWVANYRGNNLSELNSSGSFLSPSSGLGTTAGLIEPYGMVLDASGNLWISSFGNSKLVQFVGLAAPVKTPLLGPPAIP
jgi:streptogramin lyase